LTWARLSSLQILHAPKLLGAVAALALLVSPVLTQLPQAKAEAAVASKKKAKAKSKRIIAKAHPLKIPNSQVEPVAWHEIQGWLDDDHSEAFATFLASCRPILKSSVKARSERGETYRALYDVCGRALADMPLDAAGARSFFEQNFRPVRLSSLGDKEGFFTGYYEPVVEGARYPSDVYNVPLYRRPNDMVTQRLRRSGAKAKAGKKVVKRASAAYFDRAQIEDGAIAGRDLEICYLKGPIDAFFAEIQGSLRVRLEDGSVLRLNYAAGNGHPYFAVGSVLIQKGIVSREEMSMQKIRDYMEKNPQEGSELRRMNRSYVFFRETDLTEFDEAIGAQGISLTAARSIAVDRKIHTYGMPVFVNAMLPIVSEKPDTWFRRLMIAQDTGGAIVGPARADIYLGAGTEAERAAGRFKNNGQFVMLVPNELDPADEALGVPLPMPRPKDGDPASMMTLFEKPKPEKEEKPEPVAEQAKPRPAVSAAVAPVKPEPAARQKPAVEVKPQAVAPQAAVKPDAKPKAAAKLEPRPQTAAKPEAAAKPRTAKVEPKPDIAAKPDAASKKKPAPKPELAAKPEPSAKPKPAPKPAEAKSDAAQKPKSAAKPEPKAAAKSGNPFPKPTGAPPAAAANPPAPRTQPNTAR